MTAALLGLTVGTVAAQPSVAQSIHQIDIERGELNTVLTQLARQTGMQVARFSDQESSEVFVGPLRGFYTLEQALGILLSDTGLTYRLVNERTVAIVNATGDDAQTDLAKSQSIQPDVTDKKDRPQGWLGRVAAFFAALGTFSATAPAYAQEGAPQTLEEIVVTGSRVITNGDSSPSPVTVVPTEDLFKANPGATLGEALNTLPAFAGSRGATSNPTTSGSAAGGNGAANQLNLRNLESTRTLVLMDGMRVPPTLFNGVVDVDIIPQMLVERVDIVTGGVSAVYGSDAVSGVVNYVLNKRFNGLRANASYGQTEYGDGEKYNAGVAYGTAIGDRGHVEFSYEYRKEGGIDRRSDRDWLNQWGVTGAGTAANPYMLQGNLRQSGFPFGGLITTGALAGQVFRTDGVLSAFQNGVATGTSGIQVGGDGGYWDSGLVAQLDGHQIFGRYDHDLSDNMKAYVQISGNLKTNSNFAETLQLNGVTLSRTNAFLPAQYQAQMPANQPTFRLSKFLGSAPRVATDADTEQWIYMAGLEGDVGGLGWDIDYIHGESKLDTTMYNILNRQKLGAALDAVPGGSGSAVCNITLTHPGLANDCVPLNVFGPTAASTAALDYITDTVYYSATTKMDDISAALSGTLFDTWAGPFNAALSGEWRKVAFSSLSSARPTDLVDCTGIRFNCDAGATVNEAVFGETPGGISQTVYEVASEFDAPILRDQPLFHALSINGAARYTKYNTSGDYWTWKAGLSWELSDTLRFRVTRSRDIRAPNLYELFSPTSIVQIRPTDLLTGLSPTVSSIDRSNPDLKAEIGNTLTGGVVWKPIGNLSFAVDAYEIKISDAITQIQGQTPSLQRACYDSGGASPYCQQQVRPNGFTDTSASNVVQGWISRRINIAQVETWGVDFETNFTGSLFARPMTLRMLAAWQPHLRYIQPNTVTIDQGGVGFGPVGLGATPTLRLNALLRFKPMEQLTADIVGRWRNSMKMSGDPTQVWVNNRIDDFGTVAVNLAWDFAAGFGDMQLFLNVQNLFNTHPPQGAFSGNGTRAGLRDGFAIGDDPRGRTYTAGVSVRM